MTRFMRLTDLVAGLTFRPRPRLRNDNKGTGDQAGQLSNHPPSGT